MGRRRKEWGRDANGNPVEPDHYEDDAAAAALVGRPSLLTEQVQAGIVDRIVRGDRPEVAAGVNGVGRQTYYDWMRRGANGEEPFAAFRTAVAHAKDRFESRARELVLDGDSEGVGFGRAKAALEVLGRRYPTEWGMKLKLELNDQLGKYLDVAQRVLPEEYYVKLLAALAELETGEEPPTEGPPPLQ